MEKITLSAEQIKEILLAEKKAGTAYKLADKIGISPSTISRLKKNSTHSISLETYVKLGDYFGNSFLGVTTDIERGAITFKSRPIPEPLRKIIVAIVELYFSLKPF